MHCCIAILWGRQGGEERGTEVKTEARACAPVCFQHVLLVMQVQHCTKHALQLFVFRVWDLQVTYTAILSRSEQCLGSHGRRLNNMLQAGNIQSVVFA